MVAVNGNVELRLKHFIRGSSLGSQFSIFGRIKIGDSINITI